MGCRKSVEAELSEILDMNQKQIQQLEAAKSLNRLKDKTPLIPTKDESLEVYCTVDDLRKKMNTCSPFENDRMDILNKMNKAPQHKNKVAATVAHWERRVMEERTSQIFSRLQKKQLEVAKESEDAERRQETLWREQGRRLVSVLWQVWSGTCRPWSSALNDEADLIKAAWMIFHIQARI